MQEIVRIISEVLERPVTPETSMENAESWDSLKTLQIVMALDEAGYNIPLESIAEIKSVSQILELLKGGLHA